MNEIKLIDEMLKHKYRDLLLTSPYFNSIFETIRRNEISEETIAEIISILCSRISDLEKDLKDKFAKKTTESSGLFDFGKPKSLSGLFENEYKSLSGLFPDGKLMND